MSYWVYLKDNNGDLVEVPRHKEGGTVALTGTPEAELNITYNYSKYFYNTLDADDGIRYLDGKQASEVTDLLQKAVARLGTDQTDDYWDEDPGNAGHALSVLLDWANQHPEAEFEVTG